jgi:hypothetical protein
MRTRRATFLFAVLALLGVGAVLAAGSLVHTDHGGAETAAVLGHVLFAPAGLELAGSVVPADVSPAPDVTEAPDRSRAPPLG